MAISSQSQVIKYQDPILETDLELLAKVNTFEQEQFNQGEQALQNEVDNWSLLSDQAKPQDRDYINKKLNNLVSGINNLGGVNLADPNNVNQLKSLGYNLYGDQKIINATTTTARMKAFQADSANKMAGKNAKDYDPTLAEYMMDSYGDWLNDGQVGSSFEGPVALPQGTYGQYTKKVQDVIAKLQPDSNDIPQGDLDKSLAYYQIGNKYIRKERVAEAIKSVTDANDLNLINAHSWSQMRGFDDQSLANMQVDSYTAKIADSQKLYNNLLANKSLAKNPAEQAALKEQLTAVNDNIKKLNEAKTSFMTENHGNVLDKGTKQSIMSGLFFDAFVDETSNANAYSQSKTELKLNAPLAFNVKENRLNFQFAETNKYNWAKLDLEKDKNQLDAIKVAYETGNTQLLASLGIKGPASGAPLSMLPVDPSTKGASNTFTAEGITEDAATNYGAKLNNFYQNGYNYLAGNITDPNLRGLLKRDMSGNYLPVSADAAKKLQLMLDAKYEELSKIADVPMAARQGKVFNQDDATFFNSIQDLKQAEVYKEQTKNLTAQAFKAAYGDNDAVIPQNKKVTFKLGPNRSVVYSYDQLKEMIDSESGGKKNPILEDLRKNAQSGYKAESSHSFFGTSTEYSYLENNPVPDALSTVKSYYEGAKKGWEKVSQTLNPYGAYPSLPKNKDGKINPEWAKFLADKVKGTINESSGTTGSSLPVQISDTDINKVWVTYDGTAKDSKARYMAEVIYKKAGDGSKQNQTDLTAVVDLTDEVINQNNAFLRNLYPSDDASAVYGMIMDNTGYTPSGAHSLQTTSYPKGTHKYQIIKVTDANKSITAYKVMVNVPGGGSIYLKNKSIPEMGEYFPANINSVKEYVNYQFGDDQRIKDFYKENNLKY